MNNDFSYFNNFSELTKISEIGLKTYNNLKTNVVELHKKINKSQTNKCLKNIRNKITSHHEKISTQNNDRLVDLSDYSTDIKDVLKLWTDIENYIVSVYKLVSGLEYNVCIIRGSAGKKSIKLANLIPVEKL